MPKMRFGVFEDKAVERWYTLWRAGYIVSFYKETASLVIVMCALQFLFGMVQTFGIECLSLIVSKCTRFMFSTLPGDPLLPLFIVRGRSVFCVLFFILVAQQLFDDVELSTRKSRAR